MLALGMSPYREESFMSILSNRPQMARVYGANAHRRPCKRRFAPTLSLGAVALIALTPACLASRANADPIDLTTLPPYHVVGPGDVVEGILPGFTQTATANLLTVTGQQNLTGSLSTYNGPTATLTGDFTATATSTVSTYAFGGLYASFNAGYAGIGFGSDVLFTNAGLVGGGTIFLSSESTPISTITVRVSRSGADLDFAAAIGDGSFRQLYTLIGTSVLGPTDLSFATGGSVGVAETSTTTYTNFVVQPHAPSSITGVNGGTSSHPVQLPSSTIGSVSGDIGAPDGPSSDYFSFYWQGGDFAAEVGVPGANDLKPPASYQFDLCAGLSCGSALENVSVDQSNGYENELSLDLNAGYYTVGVIQEEGPDPLYSVAFSTPVIGGSVSPVPEPTTWAMLIVGFAGLGVIGYRTARKAAKLAA
jgi:hypothetical protein